MVYRLQRTAGSQQDLDLAFDHLVSSYLGFGDSIEEAFDRASQRLRKIQEDIERIARHPHVGTRNPELGMDVRHITKDSMVIYFDVDETAQVVNVLSILFGKQDHQRHMIDRLLKRKSTDA